jgi:hypothetical protein
MYFNTVAFLEVERPILFDWLILVVLVYSAVGLRRIAGACRAVYNWGLSRRKDHYTEHGKTLLYAAQNLELTALKNRPALEWLKEADSQA